jgi:hypothetical protein
MYFHCPSLPFTYSVAIYTQSSIYILYPHPIYTQFHSPLCPAPLVPVLQSLTHSPCLKEKTLPLCNAFEGQSKRRETFEVLRCGCRVWWAGGLRHSADEVESWWKSTRRK